MNHTMYILPMIYAKCTTCLWITPCILPMNETMYMTYLWITSFWCRYSTPSTIWRVYFRNTASSRAPNLARILAMEPPGTNCMKMLTILSSRLVPKYLQKEKKWLRIYNKTQKIFGNDKSYFKCTCFVTITNKIPDHKSKE